MRTIDADALKEKLNSFIIVGGRRNGKAECQRCFNKILSEIIDNEPTINPIKNPIKDMLELTLTDKRNQLFSLLDELVDMKNLAESNGEAYYRGLYSGLQIAIIKIKKYINDF